jgi:site-specific recombinase XerD
MNKPQPLTLSQAIDGYTLYANARGLSPHTIADYNNTYRKFRYFLQSDPPLDSITPQDIQRFLTAHNHLTKKTRLNYHTGLAALWTWAVKNDHASSHPLHQVERPRKEKRAIIPYSESDLRLMIASLGKSKPYTRPGKRPSAHTLPHAERNRAILLLLLDTGLRASELCTARIHHLDLRNRRLRVFGKGAKERTLPISHNTASAIWRYLSTRPDEPANAPLITTGDGQPLTRDHLYNTITSIAQRAGIQNADVHRFRHTFAINYLRNGGDAYTLQILLGHTSMEMVRTYIQIAQSDIEARHLKASPVANWNL